MRNQPEPFPTALVLVVDDNPLILELVCVALIGEFTLLLTRNSTDALRLAPIADLILLDLQLTPLNGIEVYERLRADPQTKDKIIAFLTGVDPESVLAYAKDGGVAAVFLKPISPKAFAGDVASLLPRREV